jgi:hypothetical protein
MKIFKTITDFFTAEKIEYWHRDRSIEVIALENKLDIETIKEETLTILKNEGRVEAITKLRHRFHVPLSVAWRFVDKLDNHNEI